MKYSVLLPSFILNCNLNHQLYSRFHSLLKRTLRWKSGVLLRLVRHFDFLPSIPFRLRRTQWIAKAHWELYGISCDLIGRICIPPKTKIVMGIFENHVTVAVPASYPPPLIFCLPLSPLFPPSFPRLHIFLPRHHLPCKVHCIKSPFISWTSRHISNWSSQSEFETASSCIID